MAANSAGAKSVRRALTDVYNSCRSVNLLILISVFTLLSASALHSQDLSTRITIHAGKTPLPDFLDQITRTSGIRFSYNPQIIPPGFLVTIDAGNQTLGDLLHSVLDSAGLVFTAVEHQIVIKKRNGYQNGPTAAGAGLTRRFTISGYLRDHNTGEALIGANVYIEGTTTGVMTNGYGFYSLTLPPGRLPLVFSYLGYQEVKKKVSLANDTLLSVEMDQQHLEIGEVEIVATDRSSELRTFQMSDFRFSGSTLSQLPGFAGNLDIIRALQAVPGIQTYGDGSALYYVRGGNSDQNLMLIDEVPVYNPAHLFGFVSAFSPDAINEVQVYKGDFPARYGGRLSSVIDIKAREGNMKRFGFSGNVGPYTTSLTAEGPIVREKASFLISGRISTLDWLNLLPAFKVNNLNYRFYDINAKLNFRAGPRDRLFLTIYTGRDVFNRIQSENADAFGISWNNMAGTFRWNHLFSSRIFANTTINYSRYNYTLDFPNDNTGFWNSAISNLTWKADLIWYLNPDNTIRGGAEVTLHTTNPGNVTLEDGNRARDVPEVSQYQSMEYVFHISNEQRIGKRISLKYGLRLPVWQDIGPSTIYYFDQNHQVIDTIGYQNGETYSIAFSPEPRISIQVSPGPSSTLRAGYSRTTQFLQMLSTSTSPFTSLDVWIPSGPNISPQIADQVALGYFRELKKGQFTFSVEAYYKWFHNHPDYRDHANMLFNPLIEGELRFGKAWSYGIEVMLRKKSGNLTGWIGYTWSRAFINTPGINHDQTYPANYDRPHNICLNIVYDNHKHWVFSANWIFMSGVPVTAPIGFYYLNGYSIPLYGDRNNGRLAGYHRLDLSATYIFNKPGNKFQHSLDVTLYNAYGRLNPFSMSFNKMIDDDGNFVVPSNLNGSYELVPTTISVAGIIPSINYKFKF